MPSYFVVQPNGLLARFSTVVDDFTAMNMTDVEATEEVFDEYSERAKHDAEQAITRAKELSRNRWTDCLSTIRAIHGDEAVAERLKWLEPDEPVPAKPTGWDEPDKLNAEHANRQAVPTNPPSSEVSDPQDPLMGLFRIGRKRIDGAEWEQFLECWTALYESLSQDQTAAR